MAAPTTIDQWAQYDGSGWGYNSSSGTFTWNTNLANSSEFVVLSYLRDLYSSVKTYNDNLKSGWLFTSSGYSYPSGWSGSFYKVVLDIVNNVNTSVNNNLHSNLQSYTSYPLYSYKQFIDSGLNNSQSFSSNNFIINFLSGISALNTNISYIANQFYADNASGSYNARSLLNQALHKYVDSSTADYTTILNNIKTNTDNLTGIKTDTANLSGIKTDTSNLSAILTGVSDFKTANHNDVSSVKTSVDNFKTSNHIDITSFASANHTDITSFQNDFNDITWSTGNTLIYGYRKSLTSDYITTQSSSSIWYIRMQAFRPENYIYKITIPMFVGGQYNADLKAEFGYNSNGNFDKLTDCIITTNQNGALTDIYLEVPTRFYVSTSDGYIKITSNTSALYVNPNGAYSVKYIDMNKQDFYSVNSYLFDRNFLDLFKQAKEMFFDDEAIAAKRANALQTTTVLSNYTGNGSASASAADFGDIKDSVGSVKSGLNTNVSVSNIFNIFNNNDGYGFWSDDTRNELNSTGSNRNNLKARGVSDTPLYDAKINELYNAMGVKHE